MQTLLKLYTSANTIYPLRVKASDEEPRIINQPCLCLFGTAIPDIFYEALSPKMLSNGFFARMLIFEAGRRGLGQDVDVHELPKAILKRARWWAEFKPGKGNLKAAHPGSGDQFGWTVAMSDDAGTLAVGAPLENYYATGVGGTPTSAAFNSGAVFLY